MKVKYTPGENGLNGKTYKVEVIGMEIRKTKHIDLPLLRQLHIQYEDGKKEWVEGDKFFSSLDNSIKPILARII